MVSMGFYLCCPLGVCTMLWQLVERVAPSRREGGQWRQNNGGAA